MLVPALVPLIKMPNVFVISTWCSAGPQPAFIKQKRVMNGPLKNRPMKKLFKRKKEIDCNMT